MPKGNLRTSTNPALLALGTLLVGFFLGRTTGGDGSTPTSRSLAVNQEIDSPTLKEPDNNDWHAIHVHVGDRDHHVESFLKNRISAAQGTYSQEGQDLYALDLLKQKRGGFFVDLASNHPIELSNTFRLERDYDWNGLCIEPNWQYWNALASMRRCQVIGAVGGKGKELMQFRFHPFKRFAGAFAGIVGEKFDNKPKDTNKNKELIEEERFTVGLADIFKKFHAPRVIDYLSLDVEGAEELILSEFPFDKYTFQVMNVERPSPKVKDLLIQNGYELLRTDKFGDTIWKHKSLEASQ